jgi:uncharacterized membrane protein YciS (DUF1049 family)
MGVLLVIGFVLCWMGIGVVDERVRDLDRRIKRLEGKP